MFFGKKIIEKVRKISRNQELPKCVEDIRFEICRVLIIKNIEKCERTNKNKRVFLSFVENDPNKKVSVPFLLFRGTKNRAKKGFAKKRVKKKRLPLYSFR